MGFEPKFVVLHHDMKMRNLVYLLLLTLCLACARQGTPTGGPKDETPPKFLRANPDTLSLNVDTNLKEIRIDFDEYIVLKDHTKQIVTSPNLGTNVNYSPVGTARKYLQIKLSEPLQPNTTYSINFGNAIQDNNEGNKLSNFQYVFSTGDYLDSLQINGTVNVIGQKKLSQNILVALYKADSTYNDSIILKEKPFYVARTDENGKFKLNYLHPDKYQIIAFEDKIDNMQFDLGREKIGFLPEPIDLSTHQEFQLQLADQTPAYKANKASQKDYGHIVFKVAGKPDELSVEPIDFDFKSQKISYIPKSDSLNFWFNPSLDSIEEKSKRLKFIVRHKDQIDTLSTVYSNNKQHSLLILDKTKGGLSSSRKLKFSSTYPLVKIDSTYISVKKDSLELPFTLKRDAKSENDFILDFKVDLQSNYTVEFLPEALEDFFGKTIADTLRLKFKTPSRNEIGNLKITLQNTPSHPFWIQLLNNKDDIVEEYYTTESVFDFYALRPGDYYLRILVDENENEHWDGADFFTRKAPEKAYIYPQMINVRAMWDLDETWILQDNPDLNSPEETKD